MCIAISCPLARSSRFDGNQIIRVILMDGNRGKMLDAFGFSDRLQQPFNLSMALLSLVDDE